MGSPRVTTFAAATGRGDVVEVNVVGRVVLGGLVLGGMVLGGGGSVGGADREEGGTVPQAATAMATSTVATSPDR